MIRPKYRKQILKSIRKVASKMNGNELQEFRLRRYFADRFEDLLTVLWPDHDESRHPSRFEHSAARRRAVLARNHVAGHPRGRHLRAGRAHNPYLLPALLPGATP